GGTTRGVRRRSRPAASSSVGDLVGTCPTPVTATTPIDSGLGQPSRTPEYLDRHLAVCSRSDAALHTAQRIMAEYGGVRPTHHLRASLVRAASAKCGAVDHLAGGHRGWLERQ